MSKGRNKKLVRVGGFMLKERHDELVEYNKQRESRGTYNHEVHYPNDYDEFIEEMVENFGEYEYFGHQIQTIMEKSSLVSVLEPKDIVRAVVEYLLYYSGSDKEIDVVNALQGGIGDYLDEVRPNLPEHILKYIWEIQSLLDERGSNNMTVDKQSIWDYHIKDEIEESMLDPDWVYDNSDDIDTEERLFKTYWHYPIIALDWDKHSVYDYYQDYINWHGDVLESYLFPRSEYHTKSWDRLRLTPRFDALFIDRNEFINNPEGK